MRFEAPSMRHAYADICKHVMRHGDPISPRGQLTHEELDVVIRIEDPNDALPSGTGRKLNTAIGVAEALQLIGGCSFPRLMTSISPTFANFMDDGTFSGAYGTRVRAQMPRIVDRLRNDRDTRQAVLTIWDPLRDLMVEGLNDYPCTIMLQFLIRNDQLQLHTTMRSNDVWWGLAYDAFQFTQLQLATANVLEIEAGPYFHHAVSLHAYERDFENIEALTDGSDAPPVVPPNGFGVGCNSWDELASDAVNLLRGRYVPTTTHPLELWMHQKLERYFPIEQLELTHE